MSNLTLWGFGGRALSTDRQPTVIEMLRGEVEGDALACGVSVPESIVLDVARHRVMSSIAYGPVGVPALLVSLRDVSLTVSDKAYLFEVCVRNKGHNGGDLYWSCITARYSGLPSEISMAIMSVFQELSNKQDGSVIDVKDGKQKR